MQKLPLTFYRRDNVVQISKELLGKYLFTNFEGMITGGMIVETEAYAGTLDKASHAHGGRRTKRTETMYANGGICYVYLCYGIHHLFNVVTHAHETPHAVLIRAIEPVMGIDIMMLRRNKQKEDYSLTNGPGSMCQALGINTKHDGISLLENEIWIEDRGTVITEDQIISGPRVGVAYAKEDAQLPYRFRIKANLWAGK